MAKQGTRYLLGVGRIAFTTAGILLALALLAFLSYDRFLLVNRQSLGDFLDSEVGLTTKAPGSPTVKTESSPPPLLAKVLAPAGSTKQSEVSFNTAKPSALPEDNIVLISGDFFAGQPDSGGEAEAGPLMKLVISEILFGTEDSAKEEFVELYNPNDFAVELSGWELRKKTESGSDSVLVSGNKFSGKILSRSYFLVSHPDFSVKFGADLAWSSKSYAISENNAIYLLDGFGRQIDLVGCGAAFDYENQACAVPETGFSIGRPVNADTDNNQSDFSFSKPTPKQAFVGYFPATTPSPWPSPSPSLSFLPVSSFTEPSSSPETFLIPSPSPADESPEPPPVPEVLFLQIIEIQTGLEGSANSDFVKLRNPNSGVLDLKDYKLVKKTTSGTEYAIKSWRTEDEDRRVVSGGEDFYWVNSGYQEKIDELAASGRKFFLTTATISETNRIILKYLDEPVSTW